MLINQFDLPKYRHIESTLHNVGVQSDFDFLNFNRFCTPQIVVYLLLSEGEVVYVGQCRNFLSLRIYHHIKNKKVFDDVVVIDTKLDRLNDLEKELIQKFNPHYNILNAISNAISKEARKFQKQVLKSTSEKDFYDSMNKAKSFFTQKVSEFESDDVRLIVQHIHLVRTRFRVFARGINNSEKLEFGEWIGEEFWKEVMQLTVYNDIYEQKFDEIKKYG